MAICQETMCHSSIERAPRHMPFMLIMSELVMLRFASAMACGVGLLAAHSFHNGELPCGFGAPFAVSGFWSFIAFITIIYHTNKGLSRAGGTIVVTSRVGQWLSHE